MGRSSNFNGQKNYVRYCQRVFPKNILKLYIPIFVASIPINPSISMTPRHYCYAIPYDDFGNPDWTAPWQDMVPMRCWNGQWCSMVLEIAGIITSNNWGVWIYMVYYSEMCEWEKEKMTMPFLHCHLVSTKTQPAFCLWFGLLRSISALNCWTAEPFFVPTRVIQNDAFAHIKYTFTKSARQPPSQAWEVFRLLSFCRSWCV